MAKLDLLIENAAEILTCAGPATGLTGAALNRAEVIAGGSIAGDQGRIVAIGAAESLRAGNDFAQELDASGRLVSPGFVDAHSHLLYGGDRCCEYGAKLSGEISGANLESGINSTIRATRAADDGFLVRQALADLDIALSHGTTTFEAKTGYGLNQSHEIRLLRLTAGLEHPIDIIPTFLGAHVLPDDYAGRREDYVQLVIGMLPEAAKYSRYCDVACDPACFTPEECLRIGRRARELGMEIRVHADQTGDGEGARVAAELGAASADHLDQSSQAGLEAMAAAGTVGIFFPGVTLHMMEMTPALDGHTLGEAEKPYMPLAVRRAIDAGVAVAISADFNPGSCPSISMQTMMQLAARLYRLSYAEVWNMSTLNPAVSLGLGHDRGSLEVGKRADILIWDIDCHERAINRFGNNMVGTVILNGEVVVADQKPLSPRPSPQT
jgi:imidazolonepropionase